MSLQIDQWIGNKTKILVLNREDMISVADRNAWAAYFASQGRVALFTDGRRGAVSR